MEQTARHSVQVKQMAQELGFDFCGIARCTRLDDDARKLERWLGQGMQGKMSYMEKYFELRVNPGKLVPGARSVITLLLNYYPGEQQRPDAPRISKYAYGKDYHEVIRTRLQAFLFRLRETFGPVEGRGFVDSAPVLERSWAVRSGLGWVGKNGNLINKSRGSFFFIATLIVDLELAYDDPYAKDYCGTCRRCIDACPTGAILDDKIVDGSRCISYFTIELRDLLIPEKMKGQFAHWMFGCDTCQDVCPWNRFVRPTTEPGFKPIAEILDMSTQEWTDLSENAFREIFRDSPLKRAKFSGIMRNLHFLEAGPPGS